MRKFLKQISLFLIFAAAFNLLVLISIVVLNRVAVNSCVLSDDVSAVIVGDSHTMWSIDASDMKDVVNISLNAEGYVYTYHKLKHLLEMQPNIDLVYLGFGYHNLSGYYDDYIYGFQFKYFIQRYLGVMGFQDYVEVAVRNPRGLPGIIKLVYQNGIRSGLKQQCTLYGSFPREKKLETFDFSHMQKRIAEQYYLNGDVINVSMINQTYLEKIVLLLKEHNKKIVLLNTPLQSDYLKLIPEEYKQHYDDFVRQHELQVYSFEDLSLSNAEFLPDGDHVNFSGAVLTTEKFKDYHGRGYK